MDRIRNGSWSRADLRQAVAKCIKRLPAEYRMAIILRDLQEFSYQEIAQLDCSLGTVKSRINRGRQALKEMFTALELFLTPRVLQGERRGGAVNCDQNQKLLNAFGRRTR